MFLLGIDLGTTATRAALYDSNARLASEGRAEVALHYPQPSVVEQDMEDFYQSSVRAVRQCMDSCRINPAQVAGLAFDSQMAGIGAIDEDFKPAMPFDSWLDCRRQPHFAVATRLHRNPLVPAPTCVDRPLRRRTPILRFAPEPPSRLFKSRIALGDSGILGCKRTWQPGRAPEHGGQLVH